MASKTLEILITAKDDATKVIKGMAGSLKDLADEAKLGATVMAAGLSYIGKKAIDAGSDFEQARIALNTMTGDTKVAGELLQKLSDFAIKTPFTLPEVLENSKMLMAMGSSTKNVIPELKMLGDVSAGLSVPLSRLALNFGQVRTVGHLTGRELRDFSVAGVPLLETLSKSLGKTKAELGDMVSDGEISFEMVNKAFIDMTTNGGKFNNLMVKQSTSLKGRLSNVTDALIRMGAAVVGVTVQGEVLKGGFFDIATQGLGKLMDLLNRITPTVVTFFSTLTSNMPAVVAILGAFLGLMYPLAQAFVIMIIPALKFVALGAVLGAVVGFLAGKVNEVVQSMGGWGSVLDYIKGKFAPIIEAVLFMVDRIKQILNISGEFGGIKNFFATMEADVSFYAQRIVQIVDENWQKLKNFLAFGGTEGDASIVQALQGIWNRLIPIRDSLVPLFDEMKNSLLTAGQVFQTQIVPAFDGLVQVLGPLWEAIKPFVGDFLVKSLIAVVGLISAIVVTIITVITGIASGFANAMPYIMQTIEGIIQFFRGFVQIITGLINNDLGLVWEGLKQMVVGVAEFFINGFKSIETFINGFVKGVIAIFKALYDALIGHSIIPDLVNGSIKWFKTLGDTVGPMISTFASNIKSIISGVADFWISKFNGIRSAIDNVIGAIKNMVNAAKDMAGKVAGGLKIPGFQHGGFVSGSFDQAVPAILHGGERVIPRNGVDVNNSGGGGGVNLSLNFSGPVNMDSDSRVQELADKIISILGRQNELAAKGLAI